MRSRPAANRFASTIALVIVALTGGGAIVRIVKVRAVLAELRPVLDRARAINLTLYREPTHQQPTHSSRMSDRTKHLLLTTS